jgi:hypothetical protein
VAGDRAYGLDVSPAEKLFKASAEHGGRKFEAWIHRQREVYCSVKGVLIVGNEGVAGSI